MSSIRVIVGTICVALVLVARGVWTESAVEPRTFDVTYEADTTAVSPLRQGYGAQADEANEAWDGGNRSQRVDKYGNPIETAIGDYRIDRRGEIYERHSPDTAVLRLSVPEA